MKRSSMLLALAALALMLAAWPAHAQTTSPEVSLFDVDKRLSVGARAYRSFDEQFGEAGTYSSDWFAGISAAYEITSPRDPLVKLPISIIGALDVGLPNKRVRGYIGIGFLLKKATR